jgi:hypothetical protein
MQDSRHIIHGHRRLIRKTKISHKLAQNPLRERRNLLPVRKVSCVRIGSVFAFRTIIQVDQSKWFVLYLQHVHHQRCVRR